MRSGRDDSPGSAEGQARYPRAVALGLGTCASCRRRVSITASPDLAPGRTFYRDDDTTRGVLLVSTREYLLFVAYAATLEVAGSFDELIGAETSRDLSDFVNRGVCPTCRE